MNLIKNISIIGISSFILYHFKLLSVRKGLRIYDSFVNTTLLKNNSVSDVKTAVIFESVFFLLVIFCLFFIFKLISKYFEVDKLFLLILVVSPIIFEVSGALYDKSCLKPWHDLNKILWYLPIRLALWIILYFCFKNLMPMLKVRRNLIIIGCVFIIFHTFKILSKYNF